MESGRRVPVFPRVESSLTHPRFQFPLSLACSKFTCNTRIVLVSITLPNIAEGISLNAVSILVAITSIIIAAIAYKLSSAPEVHRRSQVSRSQHQQSPQASSQQHQQSPQASCHHRPQSAQATELLIKVSLILI